MSKRFGKTIVKYAGVLAMGVLAAFGSGTAGKASAASMEGYMPLDENDPVEFHGDHIVYDGETILLGEKAVYIDGTLSDEQADSYEYVYNDFKEAAEAFVSGTEEEPMKVYIAPYVYWIDDPEDEEIRVASGGDVPYGLVIQCDNLHLIGLTKNPYHVVLAVNRGQTQGAKGNYTMFYFDGNGTRTENLTMGNYCNVDLEYPLKPELSRKKRAEAITQSQLALTNGDKIVAVNCNFLSRLNACPFVGSSGRVLFQDCHIECGDDALPGTAVFLNCTLGFYSSKPFYNTSGTGAVFLNCDITSEVEGTQYLTKAGGTVTMIDCNFFSGHPGFRVEWTPEPAADLMCIQGNITLNGEPMVIDGGNPAHTMDLTGTEAMKAFVLTDGDSTIYNTYNLLQGRDGWDPLDNEAEVAAVGEQYTQYPYLMFTMPAIKSVKKGDTVTLVPAYRYFRNVTGPDLKDTVTWFMEESLKEYAVLTENGDGSCTLEFTGSGDSSISGRVYAVTSLGYSNNTFFNLVPDVTAAPGFAETPVLEIGVELRDQADGTGETTGCVKVAYALDTEARDISVIDWYRVSADGREQTKVAVSRLDEPEYTYILTPGDVGYYIMAEVTPKSLNSQPGAKQSVKTDRVITAEDMPQQYISTDFQNFPTEVQTQVKPGFWTVDGFKPLDTAEYDWKAKTGTAWSYGEGEGGAKGVFGLTQTVRGSRILYTPAEGNYGDMTLTLQVAPCKSAGQGFGSATAQYMDVLVKMDTETLNGYGLRIERTSKYSNAVDFKLVKYTDGLAEAMTEPVSASCYNTMCTITLTVEGSVLTAHVETTKKQNDEQAAAGLAHEVSLMAEIEPTADGGIGVIHTGTAGANATLLCQLDVNWEEGSGASQEPDCADGKNKEKEPEAEPTSIPEPEETPIPEVTEKPAENQEPDCGMEQEKMQEEESLKETGTEIKPGRNKVVIPGLILTVFAAAALGVTAVILKKTKK
ncbi:MAG: hypothetical protein J6J42_00520 [Lachnospiraceae bacterium]|nr:hypothetical protein [Lachnospiraceae bacterium]MBP3608799.1 hypothetical protein [Lachnospiraceae bacterium]